MDDDRDKNSEEMKPATAAASETDVASPAAEVGAVPQPPGSVHDVPDLFISDELQRALDEAAAVVDGPRAASPVAEPFDPNRPPPPAVEPPTHEPSKKEMELKMQILDLRQQLREKDKEIEQRLKEVKQNAEQARMLQGQLESYKGRVMKEKADWFNYGHEPLLKELLQVVDNLERALAHAGKDTDPAALSAGVELIQRLLLSVLAKFGTTPLESKGQPFNPEMHQAMSQVENDGVPPGTVVEEFQKGYRLKDRLLRPAMVLVSRRSADADEPTDQGKGEGD